MGNTGRRRGRKPKGLGRLALRPQYNAQLMCDDMAARGWQPTDLASKAKVSPMTVSRFFTAEIQTPRTAKKLAAALGYDTPERYLVRHERRIA